MDEKKKYNELEGEVEKLKAQIQKLQERETTRKRRYKRLGIKSTLFLSKFIMALFFGKGVTKSINKFLSELKEGKVKQYTLSELLANIFIRFTRIGIFALLAFLIPTLFLLVQTGLLWIQNNKFDLQNELVTQQNELVTQQNELVTQQNELVTQQNILAESNRRSSLIFLFSNVMDKIDEELKVDITNRKLSPQLIGRIVSLANSFRPYKFLIGGDSLSKDLSPERGQLLIALVNAQLDTVSYNAIFSQAIFNNAYSKNLRLYGSYLRKANLNRVFLSEANLSEANLSEAVLNRAFLRGADLRRAGLRDANLSEAVLKDANLNRAFLKDANLSEADLNEANLSGANLREANLNRAFLREANLSGANLREANLSGVIVDRQNFFEHLEDIGCRGIEGLKDKYKITPFKKYSKTRYRITEK